MGFQVSAFVDGASHSSHAVSTGKHHLGSAPSCAIVISHPEVASVAAVVEVTGSVVFFENRNEFPVFIGSDQLAPGAVAEWRPGSSVQLTRAVSLSLEPEGGPVVSDDAQPETKKNPMNSAIQIVVIVVCGILSFQLLTDDSSSNSRSDGAGKGIKFGDVIAAFETAGGPGLQNLSGEERALLGYVTEAHAVERRYSGNGDRVRAAYEVILSSPLLHDPEKDGPLVQAARAYAASRIGRLD